MGSEDAPVSSRLWNWKGGDGSRLYPRRQFAIAQIFPQTT